MIVFLFEKGNEYGVIEALAVVNHVLFSIGEADDVSNPKLQRIKSEVSVHTS